MLPRGLEEMIYRVRQELRRYCPHGDVEQIGIIRGNYDPASYRWYFKADVGYHQQAAVVMDAREMDMMGFNLPRHIDEIFIGRNRRGEAYPDVELRSNGRVWNIPRAEQISAYGAQSIYTAIADIRPLRELKRDTLQQYAEMIRNSAVMGVNFAGEYMCDPRENVQKQKSRKEQLAETRPTRIARLMKAKYEREGSIPKIKELALSN